MPDTWGLMFPVVLPGTPTDRITSNANKTLRFLKRNIKIKMPMIRETAYNILVRPQLEYSSAVWDPNTKKKKKKKKKKKMKWCSAGLPGHEVIYFFFMLSSAEHEIFSTNKQEDANNGWHFYIY